MLERKHEGSATALSQISAGVSPRLGFYMRSRKPRELCQCPNHADVAERIEHEATTRTRDRDKEVANGGTSNARPLMTIEYCPLGLHPQA